MSAAKFLFFLAQLPELVGRQHSLSFIGASASPTGVRISATLVAGPWAGAEGRFLAFLQFVLDGLAAVAVFLGLEGGGQGLPQFTHQPIHVLLQPGGAPGRQAQRPRPLILFEVVDVNPVAGRRTVGGLTPQQPHHQRPTAGAFRPQGEQVEAAMAHGHGEADRLGRPLLAHGVVGFGQFGGAVERQRQRVAGLVQAFRRQRRQRHGRFSGQASSSMRSMSSSEKPKWWPISWISTCLTSEVRSSPVSHQ